MTNREIKFRAWVDQWSDVVLYQDNEETSWGIDEVGINCYVWAIIDTCPGGLGHVQEEKWHLFEGVKYMQYTGLKDKNGKEIYEGDIIDGRHNGPFIVGFCEEKAAFACSQSGDFSLPNIHNFCDDIDIESDGWRVIGNIYENPDLLPK